MEVARIKVSRTSITVLERNTIPAGLIGGTITIEYADASWGDLKKTVVFKGAVTKDVVTDDNSVRIPGEVLAEAGKKLYVGVYGTDLVNKKAIPTLYADLGVIKAAADPYDDNTADPALPMWFTLSQKVDEFDKKIDEFDRDISEFSIELTRLVGIASDSAVAAEKASDDAKQAAADAKEAAEDAENAISGVESATTNANNAAENAAKAAVDANAAEKNANNAAQTANNAATVANAAAEATNAARESLTTAAGSAIEEIRSAATTGIDGTAIVQAVRGEVVTADDSADRLLRGLTVFGRTEQVTTTGKNLLAPQEIYKQTDNYAETTVDGRSCVQMTSGVAVTVTPDFLKPNTQYTVSMSCKNVLKSGQSTSLGNVLMTFYYDDGTKTDLIASGANTDWISVKQTSDAGKTVTSIGLRAYDYRSFTYIDINTFQIELGTTATAYEPYTGGIPSPNPEYPQELESVGDVTVTVAGKNLIHFEDNVVLNNVSGFFHECDLNLPAGDYIFTCDNFISSTGGTNPGKLVWYDETNKAYYPNKFYLNESAVRPITVTGSMKRFALYVDTDEGHSYTIVKPMLRFASVTDDTYEPCKEIQTLSISTPNGLPGIPVDSGGNYTDKNGQQWLCDEVDFEKGVYVQRVTKRVYNGTEKWYVNNTAANQPETITRYFLADLPNAQRGGIVKGIISNIAVSANPKDNYDFCSENTIQAYGFMSSTGWIGVAVNKAQFPDVATFKAKLAEIAANGNPFTVYMAEYIEPIETALSADQLAAFASLHSNYPNTTVFNDRNAGMEVKYVADTKLYIDKKFNELAAALVSNV